MVLDNEGVSKAATDRAMYVRLKVAYDDGHRVLTSAAILAEILRGGIRDAQVHRVLARVAVEPVSSDAFPARAVRPRYSALDNRAWRALGEPDLPPWRVGLHDYLAALGRLR